MRIIGIGSPFGADRLGWLVIDALQAAALPPGIELVHCRQPIELPGLLTGCRRAILVDALIGGHPPGSLHRLGYSELATAGLGISSHGFGVGEAVQLAATLGNLPAELVVLGMEVGSPERVLEPEWISGLVDAVRSEIRRCADARA